MSSLADQDSLAQTMPGEALRFQEVSLEEAHQALRRERKKLEEIQQRFRDFVRIEDPAKSLENLLGETSQNMIPFLTILLAIILLNLLLFYEKKENRKPAFMTKTLLSLLFVVAAVIQPHPLPNYYSYLFIGLIFCLVGDVCLALPEKFFKAGLVAFLFGHVFYLIGFTTLTNMGPMAFARSAALFYDQRDRIFLAAASFRGHARPRFRLYPCDNGDGLRGLGGIPGDRPSCSRHDR